MNDAKPLYHGYRFPPTITSHAVWLYDRFCLNLRNVEDLVAERGTSVSHESIRQWCNRFGPEYALKLKKQQGRLGDTWYLDEVSIKINGELHYLWRAVDQDGDTIAEVSHEQTRQRERQMRRFKSAGQAQRFLTVYGVVGNLFRLGRHLMRAIHYREFRSRAFCEWQAVTCA
jgi:putative transposase